MGHGLAGHVCTSSRHANPPLMLLNHVPWSSEHGLNSPSCNAINCPPAAYVYKAHFIISRYCFGQSLLISETQVFLGDNSFPWSTFPLFFWWYRVFCSETLRVYICFYVCFPLIRNCSCLQFQKLKDAIAVHNTARCSIGPPVGVGDVLDSPEEKPAEASPR